MKKIILLALLLLPAQAFAAMDMPSDVIGKSAFVGHPRIFSVEAHDVSHGTFSSMWVQGMQEGRDEWYKARIDITAHTQTGNNTQKVKLRILAYQQTLYVTIVDSGLWAEMPLHDMDTLDGFVVLNLLKEAGVDFLHTANAWENVINSIDTQFSVMHEAYAAGNAYSIKPMSPGADSQTHIRMNINTDGTFAFGKMYIRDGAYVVQGQTQPHDGALYLDVPTRTTSLSAITPLLTHFTTPAIAETAIENMRIDNAEPTIPKTVSTVQMRRRAIRAQTTPKACGIPGTLAYVELSRKGFCATEKLHKRVIHGNDEPGRTNTKIWQERVGPERLVDAYNDVAIDLENSARRRKLHEVKALLSRLTVKESGSDAINEWINTKIIPFFVPAGTGWIGDFVLLKDEYGHEGAALQKTVTTSSGKRKNYAVFIFEENPGDEPVITDIYFNTRLSDLRAEGLIQ